MAGATPAERRASANGAKKTAAQKGGKAAGAKADKDKVQKALDEVARAEESAKKTFEFRGLTLELPDQLPATFLFDLVEIEQSGDNPMPVFRLLRSLLGAEQFTRARNALSSDEGMSEVGDLLDGVFGVYGVSLGEAEAS